MLGRVSDDQRFFARRCTEGTLGIHGRYEGMKGNLSRRNKSVLDFDGSGLELA